MTPAQFQDADTKVDIFIPIYIGDYLKDTTFLTTEQHGAYLLMLFACWQHGAIPNNDRVICRITGLSKEEWVESKEVILNYFKSKDGKIYHSRIDRERDCAKEKKRRSVAGADAKWGDRQNKIKRSERLTAARAIATHSIEQWTAMLNFHDKTCVMCGSTVDIVKDHIIPIYQGGSDGIENIQPLCRKCNCSKGPDSTDRRRDGWENACMMPAKRLHDACTSPSPSPSTSESTSSSTTTAVVDSFLDQHPVYKTLIACTVFSKVTRERYAKIKHDFPDKDATEAVKEAVLHATSPDEDIAKPDKFLISKFTYAPEVDKFSIPYAYGGLLLRRNADGSYNEADEAARRKAVC